MLCTLTLCLSLFAPASYRGTDSTRQSTVVDTAHTSQTIVVEADASDSRDCVGKCGGAETVDDLMRISGVVLIQRAQMAGEATIRGLRGGQISTTIDGMKIHAACVDKMDPATAYVEVDNLRRVELTQGVGDLRYGSNLGGSLNFNSRMPVLGPLTGNAEGGFDFNGVARRMRVDVNTGTEDVAMRVGYTLRQSDNYTAGRGALVSGSGMTKHNASAVALWQLDSTSSITTNIIYDLATDIGYPALLMDTRRAEALITSVLWHRRWTPQISSGLRLYANTVDHVMDDFDRSTDEVRQRDFMPNMRMPMYGSTTTLGMIADMRLTISATSVLSVTLDAWKLDAQATMDMLPLDTAESRMTMTNIGDARTTNVGVNAVYETAAAEDLVFRASTRVDINAGSLDNANAVSALSGYVGDVNMSPVLAGVSVHSSIQWLPYDNLSLTIALARAERMPTHLERYGFFLYDPQADIVTVGNPALRTERSMNVDARFIYNIDGLRLNGGMFMQAIDDYIGAPLAASDGDDNLDLRMMQNIGRAILAGTDVACTMRLNDLVAVGASIAYTYAELSATKEPLPLIQPLTMLVDARIGDEDLWSEVRVRGSLAQHRTSTTLMPEDATASWASIDLSAGLRIASSVSARIQVGNILDTYYNEHTSIRNLPARGRSLSVTVRYSW